MNNVPNNLVARRPLRDARRSPASEAFTLTELVVVVACLGLLFVMLLPALAGTKSQSRIAACTADFRQWTIAANLYAKDNLEWLPSFNATGGGSYMRDVGTNMCYALGPYGMDVTKWFCPMRPVELEAANSWANSNLHHPIQNLQELTYYFSGAKGYPSECIINHNYWVPRAQGSTSYPVDWSVRNPTLWPSYVKDGQPTCALYGWPQKLHDSAAAYVPFVSDVAGSGQSGGLQSPHSGSSDVNNISPTTAHFVNGQLIGVNIAFVDGRVEAHNPSQMRCVYSTTGGSSYWFY